MKTIKTWTEKMETAKESFRDCTDCKHCKQCEIKTGQLGEQTAIYAFTCKMASNHGLTIYSDSMRQLPDLIRKQIEFEIS